MTSDEFKKELEASKTEEAVKSVYAKFFSITYDTGDRHDLYTPEVLFEFKNEKNLSNLKTLATILAQLVYYVRGLKYEGSEKVIPPYLCVADKNEAVVTETVKWHSFYTNDLYDWERAPSKPDPKLIDHLVKEPDLSSLHVYKILKKREFESFERVMKKALNPQLGFEFFEKKVVNEENFEAVFEHWADIIGSHIRNGYKLSTYFLANLQRDRILLDKDTSRVVFTFEDNVSKTQKILMKDYDYFWNIYEYVRDPDTINGIHAKIDRLTEDSVRRFEGEFYTPLRFAKKAIHYLNNVLGPKWYKSGKYRIWDMAAGTGNLEWHLPAEAYPYLYLSTLHNSETDHNKKVFPGAYSFQYDFLNDDVEFVFLKDGLPFEIPWKLPKKLRDELADESLTWIVYINPPFATSQVGGAKGESKKGVSDTKVSKEMGRVGIGHARRELFAQFMFRIRKEMPNKTYLGMFAKLKYLNAPDSISFRDSYFDCAYESGFLFKSTNFHGVKGKYPISFLIWNLNKRRSKHSIAIPIDIADDTGVNIGVKNLSLIENDDVINQWFERPSNSSDCIMPPLSNALTVKHDNVDTRHRARSDFLASVCSKGNDFQNAKYVTILSSPSASAGAFTVIADNFEQSLVLHAVRKIVKPNWLNDRDQIKKPSVTLTQEFIEDCLVWSLFADSNETSSLRDVEYAGRTFQIKNNLFPFGISKLRGWEIRDPDMVLHLSNDTDRYAAVWLKNRRLTTLSTKVLKKAETVYKIFYANLHRIRTSAFRIDNWDAGWYQIRRSMADTNIGTAEISELRLANDVLAEGILPRIYDFGFVDRNEVYTDGDFL